MFLVSIDCTMLIHSNAFLFRVEITDWWSICSNMDTVQCDQDTAAWSVVSG